MQSDYVDASRVPYIVMPGGLKLPGGNAWEAGDLALVVWHGRTVFAVVGDKGPKSKLGEGSRPLLTALRQGGIQPIAPADPATTLLFPGTRDRILTHWPLEPAKIETEGRKLLGEAGGAAMLQACPGLGDLS